MRISCTQLRRDIVNMHVCGEPARRVGSLSAETSTPVYDLAVAQRRIVAREIHVDRLHRLERGSWSELTKVLAAGEIDALIAVSGVPLPELLDLDRRQSLRSLSLGPDQVVALRLAMPELSGSLIAAGSYPSLRRHYRTVGLYNFAVGTDALPQDLAYAILCRVRQSRRADAGPCLGG